MTSYADVIVALADGPRSLRELGRALGSQATAARTLVTLLSIGVVCHVGRRSQFRYKLTKENQMADVNLPINFRSLNDIIVAEDASAPNVLNAVTPAVPRGQWTTQGPMANHAKRHVYVRLEALPKELQERVKTALEALAWG